MKTTLSFLVVSVTERLVIEGNTPVFDTTLSRYTADKSVQLITIRGNPWKVGTKVDFEEMPPKEP
jgi:hypothetical protein